MASKDETMESQEKFMAEGERTMEQTARGYHLAEDDLEDNFRTLLGHIFYFKPNRVHDVVKALSHYGAESWRTFVTMPEADINNLVQSLPKEGYRQSTKKLWLMGRGKCVEEGNIPLPSLVEFDYFCMSGRRKNKESGETTKRKPRPTMAKVPDIPYTADKAWAIRNEAVLSKYISTLSTKPLPTEPLLPHASLPASLLPLKRCYGYNNLGKLLVCIHHLLVGKMKEEEILTLMQFAKKYCDDKQVQNPTVAFDMNEAFEKYAQQYDGLLFKPITTPNFNVLANSSNTMPDANGPQSNRGPFLIVVQLRIDPEGANKYKSDDTPDNPRDQVVVFHPPTGLMFPSFHGRGKYGISLYGRAFRRNCIECERSKKPQCPEETNNADDALRIMQTFFTYHFYPHTDETGTRKNKFLRKYELVSMGYLYQQQHPLSPGDTTDSE